jgi:uncharacterized protein (DUF1778 family)
MNYTITTTDEDDSLIARAAEIKGLSSQEFVSAVTSKALAGVAERVIDGKAAQDRADYLAAYDAADDKAALRTAVATAARVVAVEIKG